MLTRLWHDLWVALFVILIIVGILANQSLAVGFGAMGLLVAGISWLWNKVSLEDLSYQRTLDQQRVFIGEETTLTITLSNRKPVPLARIEIQDEVPKEIEVRDADITSSPAPEAQRLRHSTSIAWYERIRWQYRIRCLKRGYYRIGPAHMDSGDLFGFYKSARIDPRQDFLLVYPKVVRLPELGLPAFRPLGEVGGGIEIFQDLSRPAGIRDYQRGDPLKTVDWKSSARMQRLQVRTFDSSSTTTVIPVVVVETVARYWEGYSSSNFERAITVAASVASYVAERNYTLGLFSNGTPIVADRPFNVPPNRSPEQLTIILEALATIRPMVMSPMARQLAEQAKTFPMGSTLVITAAFISSELADVIRTLRARGYRMLVLWVGDDQCPQLPEGVPVHDLRDYFKRAESTGEFGSR